MTADRPNRLRATQWCEVTCQHVIDGSRITSLEALYDEITRVLVPDHFWGRNLDALDDILRGGFGTPDGGFTIRWSHSAVSREALGYPATVKMFEHMLERCHPDNRNSVGQRLAAARAGTGPTLFD
ncbi:barstar family protein [Rhizobium sp. BR 314]|uniref:barstar family protein n=1 Tax=Rhizobium sp. BR 314 TaxID=3040013 RepID=UPI0039BF49CD